MPEFLTNIQYRILSRFAPGILDGSTEGIYQGQSKLSILLGPEFLPRIRGKTVIDFGCGQGLQAIEMALLGASRVIGVDILEDSLQTGRQNSIRAGVQNSTLFVSSTREGADIVVSIDAFEHFADPSEILRTMASLLLPGGEVYVSFGPTWFHPLGGHLFSVFPWAHLLFSEKALLRWRSTFKTDGATRFSEVAGGLNQMTIARFQRLVAASPLEFFSFELVPIQKLARLHNRLTQEFTTAIVRCRLTRRAGAETEPHPLAAKAASAR